MHCRKLFSALTFLEHSLFTRMSHFLQSVYIINFCLFHRSRTSFLNYLPTQAEVYGIGQVYNKSAFFCTHVEKLTWKLTTMFGTNVSHFSAY